MDFGNLLNPTSSSQKKAPNAAFRPHAVTVTKERSLPPTGEPPKMKPLPNDRLSWDQRVTQGRFAMWEGESTQPVGKNNSWWKNESAGAQGSVQEQRRRREMAKSGELAPRGGTAAQQRRQLQKEEQERSQITVTRDRFGNMLCDRCERSGIFKGVGVPLASSRDGGLRAGVSIEPERRPNATESRKQLDHYDKTRLNAEKQIGARCQYIADCTDVAHRDWKMRFALPPQARDNDAVANTLARDQFHDSTSGTGSANQAPPAVLDDANMGTYRVLPPLQHVERVYHMNRGSWANGNSKRFASPFAKNERSAREGYVNNDTCIGRTTPVGERDSASKAPPLSCLALATADVKTAAQSSDATASRRAADSSLVRLSGVAREGRVAGYVPFSAVPQSVLNIIPSAGL